MHIVQKMNNTNGVKLIRNQQVGGSSPPVGSNTYKDITGLQDAGTCGNVRECVDCEAPEVTNRTHLRKTEYVVAPASMEQCHELVRWEHYAKGGSDTATFRHGLFHRSNFMRCLGVAWWIPPTKGAAIATLNPKKEGLKDYPDHDWKRVLSLSRLVVMPEVPTNGASYLMGRSIRKIKDSKKWDCLVTYADEYQGHTGAIYKATNWEYIGLTNQIPVWVNPRTGAMIAKKSGPKTRTVAEMKALGYNCIGSFRKHKFRMILT